MTKEQERLLYLEQILSNSQLVSMNGSELLDLASKFAKIEGLYLEKHRAKLIPKKIAVLASYTTHHLVNVLKLFLYQRRISPVFYEGEYNGIAMELMNSDSYLYDFKPDIILLLTYHTDIREYPRLFVSDTEIECWIKGKVDYYKKLWEYTTSIPACQVFQTLFVSPVYRTLGNMEANYLFSPSICLNSLNMELTRQKPANVSFIDMEYFASYFGKRRWFDEANYYLSKQGFSFDAFGMVCYAFSRIISSLSGNVKKCLALDLDNTLWGGVIGDDGLEGINVNPSDAVGESFLAFQQYLKKLKERGVILAVCSKNDENIAKLPFQNHPDMILSLDDIACFVANWNDKPGNIREIANQLNIGIDSIVFFDDNPFERDIVRQFIPEVEVIDVPEDPALFVDALDKAMCFEWNQLTEEDLSRSDSYTTDRKRSELCSHIIDYNSYLQALNMKANIANVTSMELARFSQLINKSNQFNLRTKRYTKAAISHMVERKGDYKLLHISLEDKFGKYGIISCIIVKKIEKIALIDTWVMSCRVLKRGVENAAFNSICDVARKWNCDWVVGEYLPTKKNQMVSGLYQELGFEKAQDGWFSGSEIGGSVYRMNLSSAVPKNHYITIDS